MREALVERGERVRIDEVPLVFSTPLIRHSVRRIVSGLAIAYPPRRGLGRHPWIGRRAPDVVLGDTRLYSRMRDGQFILVDLTGGTIATDLVAATWSGRMAALALAPNAASGWPDIDPRGGPQFADPDGNLVGLFKSPS